MFRFFRTFIVVVIAAIFVSACAAPATPVPPPPPTQVPVPTAAPVSTATQAPSAPATKAPATTAPATAAPTTAPTAAPTAAPTKAPEVNKVGGSLAYAVINDPDTLDLHQTTATSSSDVFNFIYEKLVYQALDKSYKGLLAESWTVSPDSKVVTFKLRQGVKFSDGSPFNAEAVKFTFERVQRYAKATINDMFKNYVAKMEAVDEYTFRLTLKEPYAPLFHDLDASAAGILSPSAVKAANDDIGRKPVGTGPYKLKEWKTGQEVVLERNPDHKTFQEYYDNKGAPYIQELRFKVIPEKATQIAALEAGEIDRMELRPQDIDKYSKDKRFNLYDVIATGVVYLGFNTTKAPFTDQKVRQALSYAVNKDEIVQVVFGNVTAKRACCYLAESIQGYDPMLEQYELKYNPTKAKQLLDGLGFKPGADGMRTTPDGKPFKPVVNTTTSETFGKVATLLQAQYRAVGIDLQIKQMDSSALLALTPKGEHDLYLNSYNWNEPDMFSNFLGCGRVQSSNRVLYCNEDFEKMIKAARTELDQTKRMQQYFDIQKFIMDQAPWQPLYMTILKIALPSKFKDVKQSSTGGLYFTDTYIAK